MCSIRDFGILQQLPGDFWSNDVTSVHFRHLSSRDVVFLSRNCLLLQATAL